MKKILKDIDFLRIEKCFHIKENQAKKLIDIIKKDAEFFKNQKLIDYSLIVFKLNCEKLLLFSEKNDLHS